MTEQTLLRRIEPVPVEPRGVNLPVRIIIGADGRVRHIHAISARPSQRQSIEQALSEWEFSPYLVAGHPTEVETGVLLKFKPAGQWPCRQTQIEPIQRAITKMDTPFFF